MAVCAICQKKPISGNKISIARSHVSRRAPRTWKPNLRSVKAEINGYDKLITGDILLKLACNKIKEAQELIGGRFVFLECEDKIKLREFYEDNGFVCFRKRNLEKDERKKNSGEYLLQMLRDLSKYNIN